MLPAVLRHCQGLHVLILGVLFATARDVCSVIATVFSRALRPLVLELGAHGDADVDEMRALCRACRVRLTSA